MGTLDIGTISPPLPSQVIPCDEFGAKVGQGESQGFKFDTRNLKKSDVLVHAWSTKHIMTAYAQSANHIMMAHARSIQLRKNPPWIMRELAINPSQRDPLLSQAGSHVAIVSPSGALFHGLRERTHYFPDWQGWLAGGRRGRTEQKLLINLYKQAIRDADRFARSLQWASCSSMIYVWPDRGGTSKVSLLARERWANFHDPRAN